LRALGPRIPRRGGRVLVGVLRKSRGAPAWPPSWESPPLSPCWPGLTRAKRFGAGSKGSGMSGPRRSANGGTARRHCRGIHPPVGELGCVRRPLFRRDLQDLWRLRPGSGCRDWTGAHGAWRKFEAAMAARDVPAAKAGYSESIGTWSRSSPKRRQQPNA